MRYKFIIILILFFISKILSADQNKEISININSFNYDPTYENLLLNNKILDDFNYYLKSNEAFNNISTKQFNITINKKNIADFNFNIFISEFLILNKKIENNIVTEREIIYRLDFSLKQKGSVNPFIKKRNILIRYRYTPNSLKGYIIKPFAQARAESILKIKNKIIKFIENNFQKNKLYSENLDILSKLLKKKTNKKKINKYKISGNINIEGKLTKTSGNLNYTNHENKNEYEFNNNITLNQLYRINKYSKITSSLGFSYKTENKEYFIKNIDLKYSKKKLEITIGNIYPYFTTTIMSTSLEGILSKYNNNNSYYQLILGRTGESKEYNQFQNNVIGLSFQKKFKKIKLVLSSIYSKDVENVAMDYTQNPAKKNIILGMNLESKINKHNIYFEYNLSNYKKDNKINSENLNGSSILITYKYKNKKFSSQSKYSRYDSDFFTITGTALNDKLEYYQMLKYDFFNNLNALIYFSSSKDNLNGRKTDTQKNSNSGLNLYFEPWKKTQKEILKNISFNFSIDQTNRKSNTSNTTESDYQIDFSKNSRNYSFRTTKKWGKENNKYSNEKTTTNSFEINSSYSKKLIKNFKINLTFDYSKENLATNNNKFYNYLLASEYKLNNFNLFNFSYTITITDNSIEDSDSKKKNILFKYINIKKTKKYKSKLFFKFENNIQTYELSYKNYNEKIYSIGLDNSF